MRSAAWLALPVALIAAGPIPQQGEGGPKGGAAAPAAPPAAPAPKADPTPKADPVSPADPVPQADAAPKSAAPKAQALEIGGGMAGENFQLRVAGAADLPDGTVVRILCERVERGKRIPDDAMTLFAEVKGGRFEVNYTCGRAMFRPGNYLFEAALKDTQREAVSKVLTEEQKAFRLAGALETSGGEGSALVGAAPKPAAKPAAPKSETLEIEGGMAGGNFQLRVAGAADLPDGTLVRILCERVERGKKFPDDAMTLFAEVRGGRFEVNYAFDRALFRPGNYIFEAALKDTQREAVSKVLTKEHKAFRLAGALEAGGGEGSPLDTALEVSRPLVTGLRAASAAALDFAKQVASASEGKLARTSWGSWKRKNGLGSAGEFAALLARKDVPFCLPSAPTLSPMAARVCGSLTACDAAADGKATPEVKRALETASFPTDDEVTRALRPLQLDVYMLLLGAGEEILRQYSAPLTPEKERQQKPLVEQYIRSWTVFKALPWKGSFPFQFGLMDDVFKDVKALLTTKPSPAPNPAGGDDRKSSKGAKGAGSQEVIVKRLTDTLGTFRRVLEAEQMKKP